jgi:hypothetical protein
MRIRTDSDNASLDLNAVVDAAVERGVIDARQRDTLRAIAAELVTGSPSPTSPSVAAERREPPVREARRGFNAITVAYSLGAMLVIFALGWFLVDRWTTLGPAGVLGVSVLYAAAFAGAGMLLRARGFVVAGGLATMLAVCITPVWTWAILRLTGELPDPLAVNDAMSRYEPYIATRGMVMELATIGVGLVALRRVRFFALAAPIAAALIALLLHLGQALGDPRLSWYVGPYYQCVVACAMLAIAYAVDRRQRDDEDYAFWFYLAGVIMVFVAYSQVWPYIGRWRHGITLVAAAFVTASLYLRRRTLLIAGGLMAFAYLGYLAFDVFRRVVALPLALAALGLLVIVATVWMQRRFPALVARVNRDAAAGARTLPVWPASVLGPLAIAGTAMLFAASEAEVRTAERDWQTSFYQRRMKNQMRAQKARADSSRAPAAPSAQRPPTPRP